MVSGSSDPGFHSFLRKIRSYTGRHAGSVGIIKSRSDLDADVILISSIIIISDRLVSAYGSNEICQSGSDVSFYRASKPTRMRSRDIIRSICY